MLSTKYLELKNYKLNDGEYNVYIQLNIYFCLWFWNIRFRIRYKFFEMFRLSNTITFIFCRNTTQLQQQCSGIFVPLNLTLKQDLKKTKKSSCQNTTSTKYILKTLLWFRNKRFRFSTNYLRHIFVLYFYNKTTIFITLNPFRTA